MSNSLTAFSCFQNYKLIKSLNKKCAKILEKERRLTEEVEDLTNEISHSNNETVVNIQKFMVTNISSVKQKSNLISKVCAHINASLSRAMLNDKNL